MRIAASVVVATRLSAANTPTNFNICPPLRGPGDGVAVEVDPGHYLPEQQIVLDGAE